MPSNVVLYECVSTAAINGACTKHKQGNNKRQFYRTKPKSINNK